MFKGLRRRQNQSLATCFGIQKKAKHRIKLMDKYRTRRILKLRGQLGSREVLVAVAPKRPLPKAGESFAIEL